MESKFEQKVSCFKNTRIAYYLANIIFFFKLWNLCHKEKEITVKTSDGREWGDCWVFLGWYHSVDHKITMGSLQKTIDK